MKQIIFRIFLLISGLEGLFVAGAILASPSEFASARFLGLSTARIMMLGGTVLLTALIFGLFLFSWWQRTRFEQWEKRCIDSFHSRKNTAIVIALLFGLVLLSVQVVLHSLSTPEPVVREVLRRLMPLIIWCALASAQLLPVIGAWHLQSGDPSAFNRKPLVAGFAGLGSCLLAWIWLARSGYGYAEETIETGVFRLPGTPILSVQIFLALLIAFGLVWLWRLGKNKLAFLTWFSGGRKDWAIAIFIWVAAYFVWMSVPLEPSWFADPPRSPNYSFSPNSDALLYESVAQSLLVGAGFWHPQWGYAVARPVYSSLLALFHLISGVGYEDIIPWQVAFVAFLPGLIFYLTSILHRRTSGVLAALLIILRERNAIVLADTITVSHAKVLMADLPATVGVVLVLTLMVLWVKDYPRRGIFPLLAGGALGFFLLIRLELGVLLLLFLFGGLSLAGKQPLAVIKGSGLAMLGFALIVTPWMWRNWQYTGEIYIVSPGYERQIIETFIGVRGDAPIYDDVYSYRKPPKVALSIQLPGSKYPPKDQNAAPWTRSEKFLHHFVNSQLQSFMYLPVSPNILFATVNLATTGSREAAFSSCCSVETYVRNLPYWWSDWDGNLVSESFMPLGGAVIVLLVGVLTLWRRQRVLGLVPVFTGVSYIAVLALLGRSGGRWILEVDWITAMMYSIGIVEILYGLKRWVMGQSTPARSRNQLLVESSALKVHQYWMTGVLILLVGITLPLMEKIIPPRYTQASMGARVEALIGENIMLTTQDAANFQRLLDDGKSVWFGRALYPRYFQSGDGMDGLHGMYKRSLSRIEFFMVGTQTQWAVLPTSAFDIEFPHASDVLLIGDDNSSFINISGLVIFSQEDFAIENIFWSDEIQAQAVHFQE